MMPIITRSKDKKIKQEQQETRDEGSHDKASSKKQKRKPFLIFKLSKQKKEDIKEDSSDDDDGSDEEVSEEDDYDDEFEIPAEIEKDNEMKKKTHKIIDYIHKKTITLQDILTSPMRLKHKAEVFELFYVFENSMLNSEERMELRAALYKLYKDYINEHKQYVANKKQIKHYEKCEKKSSSILDLQYDILKLETTADNKEIIFYKYMELKEKTDHDDEYYKLKKWIKYALDLPYDRIKEYPHLKDKAALTTLLNQMKDTLDKELFGMKRVKEQILLFLHNKLMFPEMRGCCMGLVGPPGVGKTTIARCIAKILDFPFQQISFGGVHNSEFLKGFDYTYVGSQPGEIAKCLMRMKHKNGILFFDEYEKISQNNDIVSFLLHVSDFSQNNQYRDNYLNDILIDLSCIWFVYSMNELPEDKALRDRIFTVQVDGYTTHEKVRIMVDFLFPRCLESQAQKPDDVVVGDDIAMHIIRSVSGENDKGIRTLEQAVKDIIHKINFMVVHKANVDVSFCSKKRDLAYPVVLDTDLVDVLLKDFKKEDKRYEQMYL